MVLHEQLESARLAEEAQRNAKAMQSASNEKPANKTTKAAPPKKVCLFF